MKKYIVLLFALSSLAMCEDLYLKNGFVFRNVKVLDTLEQYVRIQLVPNSTRSFIKASIERIDPLPFDSLLESGYEQWGNNNSMLQPQNPTEPIIRKRSSRYDRPNMKLIPISFISFGLSYAYLTSAKDLASVNKHRAIVPGVLFAIGGIVNLFYSFEKVEIRTDGQQLSLLYTF